MSEEPEKLEDFCSPAMTPTELLIHSMEQLDKNRIQRALVVLWSDEDNSVSMHHNANFLEMLGMLDVAKDVALSRPDEG